MKLSTEGAILIILALSAPLLASPFLPAHMEALEKSFFNSTLKFSPHAMEELKKRDVRESWLEFNDAVVTKVRLSRAAGFKFETSETANYNFDDASVWGKVSYETPFSWGISGHERVNLYFKRDASNLMTYLKIPVQEGGFIPEGATPGIYSLMGAASVRQFNYGKIFYPGLKENWPIYIAMDYKGEKTDGIGFSFESGVFQKISDDFQILRGMSYFASFSDPAFQGIKQMLELPRTPTDAYFRSQADADVYNKIGGFSEKVVHFKVEDWNYPPLNGVVSAGPTSGGADCKSALAGVKARIDAIKVKIDALTE